MNNDNVILTERRTHFREIAIDKLEPSPYQPRRHFDDETIEGLAATLRYVGILEPLCVRVKPGACEQYELIAGERRLKAAKLIGFTRVPCMVAHYSNEEAAQASLIENTSREDLDPISKAHAMERLTKEFNYTHEELAEILGITRVAVTHQLRLLKLDARIQHWLERGEMTESHAKVLAGLGDLRQQYSVAYKSQAHGWSVRALEKAVDEIKNGKPSKVSTAAQQLKVVDDAKDAVKKLGERLKCNFDVQVRSNGAGNVLLKFNNETDLAVLVKQINCLLQPKMQSLPPDEPDYAEWYEAV